MPKRTRRRATLIILGGLPGTGKTTIAAELARQFGAVHVRIDSIEQAIRNFTRRREVGALGYLIAYAVAGDNLRAGQIVIADSVNAIPATRKSWKAVARRAHASAIEIEVRCGNPKEHRRRVETLRTNIAKLKLPSWEDVLRRNYELWRPDIVIDTGKHSIKASVGQLRKALAERAGI